MGRFMIIFLAAILLNSSKAAAQADLGRNADTIEKKISVRLLPQKFYIRPTGWFCIREIQLQKVTGLPLFIRLGSKEYVDYMERKPNTALTPLRH